MSLWEEIAEQPAVLERMLAANAAAAIEVGRRVEAVAPRYAVVVARGTSDNAARYAQYVWGARNRLPVALAAPSLVGVYGTPPDLSAGLVVGISQSGRSPDLVAVVEEGRRQGAPTLAITNDPASPLAAAADHVIDLCAGEERAVAATKTYTAQLAAVAMLSRAFAGEGPAGPDLAAVAPAVAGVLADPGPLEQLTPVLVGTDRCAVLGRGFNYATAHEWALKLQELTYVLAQPFSVADFLHGPVAVVEPGFPVLAVAVAGPAFEQTRDVLARLEAERGARVVAVSDRDDLVAGSRLRVPAGLAEWLTPIPAIVAAQLFTHRLAVARGLDPDAPRGLRKVTLTR